MKAPRRLDAYYRRRMRQNRANRLWYEWCDELMTEVNEQSQKLRREVLEIMRGAVKP